ncbi:hypothetical protein [Neorhizobium sp. SOG26]|uniref:hypothetical protein n=1 Tax=Neorhizobium sp. SOG26 TaxID=2060726 RepID=UPI001900C0BE|nr:hypothetical protein [Neorhizobium sp. SOG26]
MNSNWRAFVQLMLSKAEGRFDGSTANICTAEDPDFCRRVKTSRPTVHASCIKKGVVLKWQKNEGTRHWHSMKC